jgi:hypothetical protein
VGNAAFERCGNPLFSSGVACVFLRIYAETEKYRAFQVSIFEGNYYLGVKSNTMTHKLLMTVCMLWLLAACTSTGEKQKENQPELPAKKEGIIASTLKAKVPILKFGRIELDSLVTKKGALKLVFRYVITDYNAPFDNILLAAYTYKKNDYTFGPVYSGKLHKDSVVSLQLPDSLQLGNLQSWNKSASIKDNLVIAIRDLLKDKNFSYLKLTPLIMRDVSGNSALSYSISAIDVNGKEMNVYPNPLVGGGDEDQLHPSPPAPPQND